jgi:hypothetical protein
MINNQFPCDGRITAWSYYRIVPRYDGFVGVWRQLSDSEFLLIGKTKLPVDVVGNHTVFVDPPIRVQPGDFIGVFYARDVEEGVVGSATSAEVASGVVAQDELYQNYYAQFFDDMIQEGVPFNMNQVTYSVSSATFAVQAVMDYQGISTGE